MSYATWFLIAGAAALLGLSACATPSNLFIRPPVVQCSQEQAPRGSVRVASYNIRSGLSSSIEEIGNVLQGIDADVVALQEVDVGVDRSGRINQAKVLADRLGYQYAFAATIKRGGGDYGIAMLSRLPFARIDRIDLRAGAALEPRVAIDADLCVDNRRLRVIAVHADVFPWSAAANAKALAKHIGPTAGKWVLVAGDLNAVPSDSAPKSLELAGLFDLLGRRAEGPTFLGSGTPRRIDYILVDHSLFKDATDAGRVQTPASDHIPVFADLKLP